MKKAHVLVGVLAALLTFPALAQKKSGGPASSVRMYKCVDEAGKVYYSDSPRADCVRGKEMNRRGIVVTRPGEKGARTPLKPGAKPAKTPEERRDRALLATYMSEAEIDAARDRSLQMPLQSIKNLEAKNQKVGSELFALKKQADTLASQQKPLPPDLIEDVQAKQKQQGSLESELARKHAEVERIRARFESDKARYRELKGMSAAATAHADE
jgi:hypothetical protein